MSIAIEHRLEIFDADHTSAHGNWYPCGHVDTPEELRKLAEQMKAKGYKLRLVTTTTIVEEI
jgi:hypothetical protein